MEHRYCVRTHSDIQILIYKHNIPVAIGKLSNISQSGLFVATQFNDIERHQALEIEILSRSARERSRFSAVVARKENEGLGLEISDQCADGSKTLGRLMADRTLGSVIDGVSSHSCSL